MHQSDFTNSIFRFTLIASASSLPDPADQSTFSSQALVWDRTKALCGQSYTSDITYAWASDPSVNVRVTLVPGIADGEGGAYGTFQAVSCGGLDCIQLDPNRPTTTFAHEIGHLLGFLHSRTSSDLMCNEGCPDYEARDVQGWHIQKLLAFYRRYF
jgi:hypothetical protein